MLKRVLLMSLIMLLAGCGSLPQKQDANLPQKPYNEWRIGGRYPSYFEARVYQVMMKTQSNEWKMIDIIARPNINKEPSKWSPLIDAASLTISYDLPQELYICWSSFVDQTFYKTKLEFPLDVRLQMVTPNNFYDEYDGTNEIYYRNKLIIGFAPGGNVTAWLTGIPRTEGIEVAKGITQRIPQGSDVCPNPYPNGKITEISDEAKAWLKEHGMPEEWQEKNNNITIGPDIRIKNMPAFGSD